MSSTLKILAFLLGIGWSNPIQAQLAGLFGTYNWYRFSVTADGVYKIDYSTLKNAGLNPDKIDPRELQLYGSKNGMLPQRNDCLCNNYPTELAVFVQGGDDGKFDKEDYLLFWGEGPDAHYFDTSKQIFAYENNLYSDKNFYFLAARIQGKRLKVAQNLGGSFPVINTFDDFGYYETDQNNILKSGREWFGEQFDSKPEITVRFNLDGVVNNSPIKMVSATMAQAYSSSSSFNVFFNDISVLEQTLNSIPNTQYGLKGMEANDTVTFNSDAVLAPGRATQDIKYQYVKAGSGTSVGYLNYFLFSLKRELSFSGNQTVFLASQSLSNPVSTFEVASVAQNTQIWDVTDPFQSKIQSFILEQGQATFSVSTDTLKKFVAFTLDKVTSPTFEAVVDSQNLSGMSSPDLLIVTHPDFKSEAERLAAHRRSHNQINVEVVTIQEIYNEYSAGKQDVTAIRDFVRSVYNNGNKRLDNLLLFGRCSYDYKDRVLSNTNFVPTYESRNSLEPLETYSSDDYFAFLEPNEGDWPESPAANNSMDIGVGRISVVTLQEAKDVVDKLIEYDTSDKRFGPWHQNIAFVADDGDFNIHQSQADQLASTINASHPEFNTNKIYLDAFKQITLPTGQFSPQAKDALDRAVEDGTMIVNFTGHGNEELWMQERILDAALIKGWKNGPMYPLFVTATCEFGRHDDPFQISSGEKLLLQKKGGSIGLVTTARPVNSSTNFELNKAFYDALFVKTNGQYRDLGQIFRDTKNNSLSGIANRNFSLLGDPSMRLAFPENQVQINSIKTAFNSDTLKALSTVVVRGEIQQSGIKRSDFQGEVDATLLDRPVSFTTLGDENPPFTYTRWSNIIFRGKASVTAGDFQIEFVVPKDLEADLGQGKLILYANNGLENAGGSMTVAVGGAETIFPPDTTPPEIKLFIGDTTFINGGIASPNTTLVAQFKDVHGIAITGYHDVNSLVAALDDSLTFSLNNYYTAAKNDFSQGTILFSLKELQKGKHHIVVQASDTYSNRSSASIDFVVSDVGILISEFYNYPNPFSSLTGSTVLGFTHNRPGEDLDADLIIYDLAGHVVDSRHYSIAESFSHVTLAEWDGANVDGNKLGSGIYLSKLSVRSLLDGSKNEQIRKLIIVN